MFVIEYLINVAFIHVSADIANASNVSVFESDGK